MISQPGQLLRGPADADFCYIGKRASRHPGSTVSNKSSKSEIRTNGFRRGPGVGEMLYRALELLEHLGFVVVPVVGIFAYQLVFEQGELGVKSVSSLCIGGA